MTGHIEQGAGTIRPTEMSAGQTAGETVIFEALTAEKVEAERKKSLVELANRYSMTLNELNCLSYEEQGIDKVKTLSFTGVKDSIPYSVSGRNGEYSARIGGKDLAINRELFGEDAKVVFEAAADIVSNRDLINKYAKRNAQQIDVRHLVSKVVGPAVADQEFTKPQRP